MPLIHPTVEPSFSSSPDEYKRDQVFDSGIRLSLLLDPIQTTSHISLPSFVKPHIREKYLNRVSFLGRFYKRDKWLDKRLERVASCCNDFFIYLDPSEARYHARPARCFDKLCPICHGARSARLRARFEFHARRMKNPRLWTLTLKNYSGDPRPMRDRLIKSFQSLRRTAAFKSNCKGGLWVVEYTYNKTSGTWHFHLHLILDALFMPWESIRDAWKRITKDSFVVHFRKMKNPKAAAAYVAAYVNAIPTLEHLPDKMAYAYLLSMKGARDFGTWGTAYARNLPDLAEDRIPSDWLYVGRWSRRFFWGTPYLEKPHNLDAIERAIVALLCDEHDIGAMMHESLDQGFSP